MRSTCIYVHVDIQYNMCVMLLPHKDPLSSVIDMYKYCLLISHLNGVLALQVKTCQVNSIPSFTVGCIYIDAVPTIL